ncbi:MAG: hypothetical protein A2W81_04035 [Betaproteobacteria bacterium RIFCSPLOWO2_12_61_14]|nr:MAG: hypothetical protein A2W81_04035 [Betaproteobacteria bacterium RIFCSPLOWO2_12_61_14]
MAVRLPLPADSYQTRGRFCRISLSQRIQDKNGLSHYPISADSYQYRITLAVPSAISGEVMLESDGEGEAVTELVATQVRL